MVKSNKPVKRKLAEIAPPRKQGEDARGEDARGGDELFEKPSRAKPLNIALDLIDPNPQQARQGFDEAKLEELAASVREHGVMQPIGVRQVGDRYVVIYGERRYRAASMAALTEIPATIHDVDEQQAAVMTALENLQREDLDIEDEARYFQTLLGATSLSQRELATRLGITHNYLSRRVRMLQRPDLMAAFRNGDMTMREVLKRLGGNEDGPDEPAADPIEREELGSVSRGYSDNAREQPTPHPTFRWRRVERSLNALRGIRPDEVADDERETFKQYLEGIRAEVVRLMDALG
jgi:ParB/RepB/Spo0J family partition protein